MRTLLVFMVVGATASSACQSHSLSGSDGHFTIETVASSQSAENAGHGDFTFTSLAVAADDRAYIAYNHGGTDDGNLWLAQRMAGQWSSMQRSSGLFTGANARVNVATDDTLYLSYTEDEVPTHLHMLAGSTLGDHPIPTLIDQALPTYSPTAMSMALDSQGKPHNAYIDEASANLNYATDAADGWHQEQVTPSGPWPGLSVAMGPDDVPAIAFSTSPDLRFSARSDSGWSTEIVDTSTSQIVLSDRALAFDPLGQPHIVYTDQTAFTLKHAFRMSDGWHLETVPVDDREVILGSMAFDAAGRLCVAFFYRDQDLGYLVLDAGTWSLETITTGMVQNPSLALDAAGRAHVSFVDTSAHLVKYAVQTQ
jgi:hypothetical protein